MNNVSYSNGKIKTKINTFNCNDDTDMEILCNNINSLLIENEIEIHKMQTQLLLIKKILDLGRK